MTILNGFKLIRLESVTIYRVKRMEIFFKTIFFLMEIFFTLIT